jgi:hypothetical protein
VLFLVATVMMGGYIFWDIVSPISTSLKARLSMAAWGGPLPNMASMPAAIPSSTSSC